MDKSKPQMLQGNNYINQYSNNYQNKSDVDSGYNYKAFQDKNLQNMNGFISKRDQISSFTGDDLKVDKY